MKLKFGFVKLRYRGLQKKLFGLCSTNHGIPLEFSSAFSMVHRLHTKCRLTHSFPSLRRFLTVAPACWPQGKIPPHPSARSARHWSPQNGGPKGKMIGGRSSGCGRGTRRELWPHLTAVLQPADRTLYRVPTLDLRRPLISFPPPLPHRLHLHRVAGPQGKINEGTFGTN